MTTPSAYLSPEVTRWTPRTEADLEEALRQGLLEETHYLEMKRELEPGKGNNKEHARDLASLAIDGGTLLVGIAENKGTHSLGLAPQPLRDLAERVEGVARAIPDPPLAVLCRTIPSEDDPGAGYLIVHVPPSAMAPHMVDHKYLGRGEKTKQYLSDAEVRRLHDQQRVTEKDGLALLQQQFERDPVPAEKRRQAHLFLLAEPTAGRENMLLDLVHGENRRLRLHQFASHANNPQLLEVLRSAGIGGFSPSLEYATSLGLRPAGVALHSSELTSDRTVAMTGGLSDEDVVELEIDEYGGLRIFMSRLSDTREDRFMDQPGATQILFPSATVMYARQFVALVAAAAEQAGYLGTWVIAVGATGLQGVPVYDFVMQGDPSPRYVAGTYELATRASYAELIRQPGRVTERLIGRLLRSLGVDSKYAQALTDLPSDQ